MAADSTKTANTEHNAKIKNNRTKKTIYAEST